MTTATARMGAIKTDSKNFNSEDEAQKLWASRSIASRLAVLKKARNLLALRTTLLATAISSELSRTLADTRVAEILPFLAAGRYLELETKSVLRSRKISRRGRPFWMAGVISEVRRVPFGRVLIIGPSNYPLFIPGVQVLQALAAGNAATWKPGRGGQAVADLVAAALLEAGLPAGLLHVTDDSIESTVQALATRPDKVFFTGSAETGRLLMHKLADTLTPSVMELSGCDAMIVLPSADIHRVVRAVVFGMRLNGSATCMAPRRLILVGFSTSQREDLVIRLESEFKQVPVIGLTGPTRRLLLRLLQDAKEEGATVHGRAELDAINPILVTDVRPGMQIAQADIFAPLISVIEVAGEAGVVAAQEACPFALTTAIFGNQKEALKLASLISTGVVLINDIIAPAADPRLPFGGRRQSGFGVTRGAEGLLEMTAVKTVAIRKNRSVRHYDATASPHETLFDGLIAASHAESWTERWHGLKQILSAGRRLNTKQD